MGSNFYYSEFPLANPRLFNRVAILFRDAAKGRKSLVITSTALRTGTGQPGLSGPGCLCLVRSLYFRHLIFFLTLLPLNIYCRPLGLTPRSPRAEA
jgi:hypothetical protein